MVSNEKMCIQVARAMYQIRFPEEDVSGLTMQQLRGREGSRMRKIYREQADRWGIPWKNREYDSDNYEKNDAVNKALSAGNACLYGLAHAVITALGCSPGLGFVHTGNELSFVYDIADLYKAETTIPTAFEIAFEIASGQMESGDVGGMTRRRLRDCFKKGSILERMVGDIMRLLGEEQQSGEEQSAVSLWNYMDS